MCGHVGIAGRITVNDEKVLRTLLILDSLRGEHSTGVAFIPSKGDPEVVKQVGDPFALFNDRRYEANLRFVNRALIGHNRFATQGKVNRSNAHPFEFDNVVGAHNGTLTSRWKLDKNSQFDVDSQALFHHIDKFGVKDAIEKVTGAWALVWWNKEDETINFLRNEERPLYHAYSESGETLYWASEQWMLDTALSRQGVKYSAPGSVKPNLHIAIPVNNKGELGKGVIQTVEAPKVHIPPKVTQIGPVARPGVIPRITGGKETPKDFTVGASHKPFPDGFLGTKDGMFELLKKGMDSAGSTYFEVAHPVFPKKQAIRMYVRIKDPYQLGDIVTADISEWSARDGGYFKLAKSSVKLIIDDRKEKKVLFDIPAEQEEEDDPIVEVRKKKYDHYCTWCGASIDHSKENKYAKTGKDVLCAESCAHNPEVAAYL